MSEHASEMCALVAQIDPVASAVGTSTGDVIDASLYDEILFILQVGNISSSTATIKLTVYEGTVSTAASITTSVGAVSITASGTGGKTDWNKQYIYCLDTADLSGPTYRYVKGTVVRAVKDSIVSMTALGFKPRWHPASDGDLATVTISQST